VPYDVILSGCPGGTMAPPPEAGLKVAMSGERETLGAPASTFGCDYIQALLHAWRCSRWPARIFPDLGIEVTPKLNLPAMMKQKEVSVGQRPGRRVSCQKTRSTEHVQGASAGPGKGRVTGADGA